MPRVSQLLHPPEAIGAGTGRSTDAGSGADAGAARVGLRAGQTVTIQSSEPPFGELALTGSDASHLHVLDWQSERLAPLLKNVARLTAPNAGFMTGPGTNSYLVGDATSGFIVIDPGPDDDAHVSRLFLAAHDAGGQIRAIVCTHSHPDHSPGAPVLQALCQQQRVAPLILGLPSAPTASLAHFFRPDRALRDGERLSLVGKGGKVAHTLRVIFTPGHAANHVCLVLEEDGLLFSGDHILNGSTTIIDPPDGDMSAYLDSLDKLDAVCEQDDIRFVLPAHGHVLADPRGAIAHLRAHRLAREAKVLAALRADPQGNIDRWVERAYDDTPSSAWKAAKRSLLAHMERLRKTGAV